MQGKYPKTLKAVSAFEGSAWAVADALIVEVATNENGNVRQGEWPRVQAYLAENGYAVGEAWLRDLRAVAVWSNAADSRLKTRIRGFSPRSVKAAKAHAKGDYEFALEILKAHGGKLHKIAGSDPLGDFENLSEEQKERVAEKLIGYMAEAPSYYIEEIGNRADKLENARRSEHDTTPTVGGVTGDPDFQARMRESNAEWDEYHAVMAALPILARMDEEKVAERFKDVTSLSMYLGYINTTIEKLSVVRDRLTAEALSRKE